MSAPIVVVHDDAETREAILVPVAFADPMDALAAVEHNNDIRVLVPPMSFGHGALNG